MKKLLFIAGIVLLASCEKDDIVEQILKDTKEKEQQALLDIEPRDPQKTVKWPFRYRFLSFNGITKEGVHPWEGEMFDYDNDGIADMVSMGTTIKVVSNIYINEWNPYTLTRTIKLSDYIDYDEYNLWTSHGVMYDFNKDGKLDHWMPLCGETNRTGTMEYNRGPSIMLMSDGNSFKASVVDERPMFRFNDTSILFDYNRDGNMDILSDFDFTIYQNNGDGTFKIIDNPFPRVTTNPGWLQMRIADLNEDGYEDIIGLAFNGLEIHYGTSDYTKFIPWYEEWDYLDGWMASDVTITNVDGIGYKEILATYSNWKGQLYTRIFKFDGTDYFIDTTDAFHQLTKSPSWDLATRTTAFDYDSDGDEDIFFQQINEYTNYFFENVDGKLVKKSFN